MLRYKRKNKLNVLKTKSVTDNNNDINKTSKEGFKKSKAVKNYFTNIELKNKILNNNELPILNNIIETTTIEIQPNITKNKYFDKFILLNNEQEFNKLITRCKNVNNNNFITKMLFMIGKQDKTKIDVIDKNTISFETVIYNPCNSDLCKIYMPNLLKIEELKVTVTLEIKEQILRVTAVLKNDYIIKLNFRDFFFPKKDISTNDSIAIIKGPYLPKITYLELPTLSYIEDLYNELTCKLKTMKDSITTIFLIGPFITNVNEVQLCNNKTHSELFDMFLSYITSLSIILKKKIILQPSLNDLGNNTDILPLHDIKFNYKYNALTSVSNPGIIKFKNNLSITSTSFINIDFNNEVFLLENILNSSNFLLPMKGKLPINLELFNYFILEDFTNILILHNDDITTNTIKKIKDTYFLQLATFNKSKEILYLNIIDNIIEFKSY